MNKFQKKISALICFGITSVGINQTTQAEYYVAAFDHGAAFTQLMDRDSETAKTRLSEDMSLSPDYADTNNLCVNQILTNEYSKAIDSCQKALEKVPDSNRHTIRIHRSQVQANLAVAKAMAGDRAGAIVDLEKSLSIYGRNKNATKNYEFLTAYALAD